MTSESSSPPPLLCYFANEIVGPALNEDYLREIEEMEIRHQREYKKRRMSKKSFALLKFRTVDAVLMTLLASAGHSSIAVQKDDDDDDVSESRDVALTVCFGKLLSAIGDVAEGHIPNNEHSGRCEDYCRVESLATAKLICTGELGHMFCFQSTKYGPCHRNNNYRLVNRGCQFSRAICDNRNAHPWWTHHNVYLQKCSDYFVDTWAIRFGNWPALQEAYSWKGVKVQRGKNVASFPISLETQSPLLLELIYGGQLDLLAKVLRQSMEKYPWSSTTNVTGSHEDGKLSKGSLAEEREWTKNKENLLYQGFLGHVVPNEFNLHADSAFPIAQALLAVLLTYRNDGCEKQYIVEAIGQQAFLLLNRFRPMGHGFGHLHSSQHQVVLISAIERNFCRVVEFILDHSEELFYIKEHQCPESYYGKSGTGREDAALFGVNCRSAGVLLQPFMPNLINLYGWTPDYRAEEERPSRPIFFTKSPEMIRLLKSYGCDLNLPKRAKPGPRHAPVTFLQEMLHKNRKDMVLTLLAKGATLEKRNHLQRMINDLDVEASVKLYAETNEDRERLIRLFSPEEAVKTKNEADGEEFEGFDSLF